MIRGVEVPGMEFWSESVLRNLRLEFLDIHNMCMDGGKIVFKTGLSLETSSHVIAIFENCASGTQVEGSSDFKMGRSLFYSRKYHSRALTCFGYLRKWRAAPLHT